MRLKKQQLLPDTKVYISVWSDDSSHYMMEVTHNNTTVRFSSEDSVHDLFEQLGRKSKGHFVGFVQYSRVDECEFVVAGAVESFTRRHVHLKTIDH